MNYLIVLRHEDSTGGRAIFKTPEEANDYLERILQYLPLSTKVGKAKLEDTDLDSYRYEVQWVK